jgi:hypothetical protein
MQNFCPNCGHKLIGDDLNAPPPHEAPTTRPAYAPAPDLVQVFIPKLMAMLDRIDEMSEDEYGNWVNALSREEFLYFIHSGSQPSVFLNLYKEHQAAKRAGVGSSEAAMCPLPS